MTIENGKIVKATESELFLFYLHRGLEDTLSFWEFRRMVIDEGGEVIEDRNG